MGSMTPLKLEILLHYYGRADDYRDGDFSAPAVNEALQSHCADDLMQRYDPDGDDDANVTKSYELTDRGRHWRAASTGFLRAHWSNGMAKRPDLDAIEDRRNQERITGIWTTTSYADIGVLLIYCRKLETENKLLRERALAAEQVIYEELPS